MRRRTLLTCAGVTLAPALAGCSTPGSVDAISVSGATVQRGETANIDVTAPNLTGLHIGDHPDAFRLDGPLDLGDATFRPPPDAVWQAHPPHWAFSGRDTRGTVPIRTVPDTPPGTYRFGFAFHLDGSEEPRHEETTVTVEGGST